MQWLSGLYYADFISFYSPTQLRGGGTTKSNSNELPISVPLSVSACQTSESFYVFSFLVNPARPIEATSKICGKNWMR